MSFKFKILWIILFIIAVVIVVEGAIILNYIRENMK